MVNEKEVENKYIELQLLMQQIKPLQQQIILIEQQILDYNQIMENLNEISNLKEGEEIFTQLNPGIFIKTTLKDNKNVIINIGADTVVTKDTKNAKEFIDKQINELKNINKDLEDNLKRLLIQSQDIQKELQNLIKEGKYNEAR